MDLPNTAQLLTQLSAFAAGPAKWALQGKLPDRLGAAYKFFYPDAANVGFQPDVVDFFSTLRTYIDVGAGHAGGFTEARLLHTTIKAAIAQMLVQRVRDADAKLKIGLPFLAEMVRVGNIVITSNWDPLIERFAELHDVPLRYGSLDDDSLTLLKLHGSVDWCLGTDMRPGYPDKDYAELRERLFASRTYTIALTPSADREATILRVRALEDWNHGWQRIKSRQTNLHMVTMVRGKTGDLGGLETVWQHAYDAVSRAKSLIIAGYSLPADDIEIRALLRSAVQRGPIAKQPKVIVKNPAPDVHHRVRQYLAATIESDFRPVG